MFPRTIFVTGIFSNVRIVVYIRVYLEVFVQMWKQRRFWSRRKVSMTRWTLPAKGDVKDVVRKIYNRIGEFDFICLNLFGTEEEQNPESWARDLADASSYALSEVSGELFPAGEQVFVSPWMVVFAVPRKKKFYVQKWTDENDHPKLVIERECICTAASTPFIVFSPIPMLFRA